jgi:hypothetical protein
MGQTLSLQLRDAYHRADHRSQTIDRIISDIQALQRNISVMQKAVQNPPNGASEQEMADVVVTLRESLDCNQRALCVLAKLGVEHIE